MINDREKAIMLLSQTYGYAAFCRSHGVVLHDQEKLNMWDNLLKLAGVKLTIKEKTELYDEVFEQQGKFERMTIWAHTNNIDLFKESM